MVGKIDLHEDTVESMLSTASILQLGEVTRACCTFLRKQLHPSNCIGICLFADRQSCMDLKKAAQSYIAVYTRLLMFSIDRNCNLQRERDERLCFSRQIFDAMNNILKSSKLQNCIVIMQFLTYRNVLWMLFKTRNF